MQHWRLDGGTRSRTLRTARELYAKCTSVCSASLRVSQGRWLTFRSSAELDIMNGAVALYIVPGGDFLSCHDRIILVVVAEAVAALSRLSLANAGTGPDVAEPIIHEGDAIHDGARGGASVAASDRGGS